MNLKRMTASVMLVALAVATGVTVGKTYLDANVVNEVVVNATESELRESDSAIASLVSKADSGTDATSFSAIELYLIAESKLESVNFLKEMVGVTNSASVNINIKSQRIKYDDVIVYYKLSPSKTIAGITTPIIANKTVFNYNSPNKISVISGNKNTFTDTSSAASLNGCFTEDVVESSAVLTKDQYREEYNTTPDSSFLSYIISSNTCDASNCSEVTANDDGTYSFTISFSGASACALPALYYTKEITSSSGYTNAKLSWTSISMTVTIDSSFRFSSISYYEVYTLGADNLPLGLTSTTVKDTFNETFYYENSEILEHAITDFADVLEVA